MRLSSNQVQQTIESYRQKRLSVNRSLTLFDSFHTSMSGPISAFKHLGQQESFKADNIATITQYTTESIAFDNEAKNFL